MTTLANPVRGEAALIIAGRVYTLRATFTALVAAECALGPLLPLVDRAADGRLTLQEIAALFWHCLADREGLSPEAVGEAVMAQGLAATMPQLRIILQQILAGNA